MPDLPSEPNKDSIEIPDLPENLRILQEKQEQRKKKVELEKAKFLQRGQIKVGSALAWANQLRECPNCTSVSGIVYSHNAKDDLIAIVCEACNWFLPEEALMRLSDKLEKGTLSLREIRNGGLVFKELKV